MVSIRNVAIIAHVDHGKTTLVDRLITHCLSADRLRGRSDGLLLDNNDLERERGITILSKNVSVMYGDVKINLIDTPGHADFGGEVERVLNMADGVLLLVDAFEGVMPQTRFVLEKALGLGLKVVVVINKVDKPNCRPDVVQEQVFDLMFALEASEEQLDFPTVYGSAKQGWMSADWREETDSVAPLLDAIVEQVSPPEVSEGSVQLLITSLDYSPYLGRIAIGKLSRGRLSATSDVVLKRHGVEGARSCRIKSLMVFEGMGREEVPFVEAGDICAVVGLEDFEIGDTLCAAEGGEALPTIAVDEPTMSMLFTINNSPFYGREGKYVTSRHLKDRLMSEQERNLALRVEGGPTADSFQVYGRGVLHLSILIETMRREGYELQVGQPHVVTKEVDGQVCEPIEYMSVELPESLSGRAIELVTQRRGVLLSMESRGGDEGRMHLEFEIPSRGMIGLRTELITATGGESVISHRLKGFEPLRGPIESRHNGSLVALETGTAYAYALWKLQDRGDFFIDPPEEVYAGQVVGESTRDLDIVVNVCKSKKLTNMRASGSDERVVLPPPRRFSLEEALEYIRDDEYVEVTPQSLRLRKIELDENARKRQRRS